MSSLMTEWEIKVRRWGLTLAILTECVVLMMVFRRFSKAVWGPPSAGEGVGISDMVVV